MAGIITISVAVGVQERPATAPQAPLPWDKGIASYVKADFLSVVSACIVCLSIFCDYIVADRKTAIFGLAGTPMVSTLNNSRDRN